MAAAVAATEEAVAVVAEAAIEAAAGVGMVAVAADNLVAAHAAPVAHVARSGVNFVTDLPSEILK